MRRQIKTNKGGERGGAAKAKAVFFRLFSLCCCGKAGRAGARAAVFFLVFSLCCCGKAEKVGEGSGVSEAPKDSVIRIAYVPALDALPFFVAQERGMFAAEGLAVELESFKAHLDIDTALIGGSADGAFTDIIRVEQLDKKDSVKMTLLTSTEAQWTLITNRVARINRLQQFGDKTVAMTRFSATDYLTDATFDGVQTKAMVFKVQINNVELRLKMLQNNELDALWLPEPYATTAIMKGHKRILSSLKYKKKLGVLALRKAFTDKTENAKVPEKLCKIYDMACDTINKYGLKTFAPELEKYCSADSATVNCLPETKYSHAGKPGDELLKEAKNYLNM